MKILWLKTELLHPVDKGGKIRTYHMLKELKRDHHITYLTLDDNAAALQERAEARERAMEYCHEAICIPHRNRAKFSAPFYADLAINLISPLPYFMQKYISAPMRWKIAELVGGGDVDLLVCDFLMPSTNVPARLPCPTLLFQHNVEAMIWRRHYEAQTNPVKRAYLYGQWRKTAAYERKTCRRFDQVVAVSAEDREVMEREYGLAQVFDVPTGVDTEYFSPIKTVCPEPNHLVFTGSMDWLPNEDAMVFFAEQVLPCIAAQLPDVTLKIVGRNPTPRVQDLAWRHPQITITGRVDDVRPHVARAAACIVPLRIGGGTRLKIYEAMAMGKAVVSTTIGAEGLPVRAGDELLIADEPGELAQAIVRALTDEALNRRLGLHARAAVCERFGWKQAAAAFSQICERAARSSIAGGKATTVRPPVSGWAKLKRGTQH